MEPSQLIEPVKWIAADAGKEILNIYGDPVEFETKGDHSPLTRADLASHHLILHQLKRLTPDTPVLSEESAALPWEERRNWERFWLVDPLDGTKEFIKKTGEFTVNIALIQGNEPVLGIVYAPSLDLMYWATKGSKAFKSSKNHPPSNIQVRRFDHSELSIVASRDHAGPLVNELLNRFPSAKTRSMGSSLKFCLVAEGAADVYLRDVPTMEWDTAAAQCIVESAGGRVCDLEKGRLRYNKATLRNPPIITLGDPSWNWNA